MSTVYRFEDLIAWQKARKLAGHIHRVVNAGSFLRDYGFRRQIWDAALSVSSNIAEGFERYNPAEFAHFLSIAKASCAEVRSDLYVAFDVGHIDEKTLRRLLDQATECGKIIGRLRRYIQTCGRTKNQLRTQNSELRT
jgi:four helix bundle protein